ncbi:MAG TPA: RIP metalloprotease RseP [Burkholderiaceae bacterium]|nr:RIP metalloprotease RseP [Burkholderiaceae bacterium]
MNLVSTVAAFLVTLGVLILIHELGHYWVARWTGVKVLRFSIGFGRPIARWVRGPDRTEWVVSALPFGGYVRMLDERDPEAGPVAAAELPRAFNRQSVAKRFAIVIAGPIANLLLAIFVYWLLNVIGVYEPRATLGAPPVATAAARAGVAAGDTVTGVDGAEVRSWNELRWLLLQKAVAGTSIAIDVEQPSGHRRSLMLEPTELNAADLESDVVARLGIVPYSGPPRVNRLTDDSAAARAGLRAGDTIVEADGARVTSARDLIERIRASAGRSIELGIERGAEFVRLPVTPTRATDEQGRAIGRIGAELSDRPPVVKVQYGPVESVALATAKTWDTAVFSLKMLGKMIVGEASWRNLSGPVTIADYAGQTARIGLAPFLNFLALVSISLAVLNLLPIPMLDGGHLLYYLIEFLKGSPPAEWVIEWGQRAGVALLGLLTMLALYNDLMRLLS